MNIKSTIELWVKTKQELTEIKELEAELRVSIAEELFPTAVEGSSTTMVDGIEIKLVAKLNRTINVKAYESSAADLTPEELSCIKLKPSLALAKYKALDDKRMVDKIITTTPGMPTLTVL